MLKTAKILKKKKKSKKITWSFYLITGYLQKRYGWMEGPTPKCYSNVFEVFYMHM